MTKKIIASFLGLAMALMMVPGMAQGQTVEELQDQIADLLAQITLLQAQVTALTGGTPGVGVPAACTGITFTVDLSQGSTGNDVKCLQALLNTDPVTQLGTTGAGSPGSETTYFGPLTHAAVVKFQDQHAAEILTPIGLTSGTGYVGPATIPVLNAMLTAVPECTVDADCLTGYICVGGECMPAPECTLDADCPTGYECVAGTCQTEADGEAAEGILTAQINPVPASGAKIYEGDTEVAIMGILLKAKLSDITVQRITFNFGAHRIYDYLTYLALYDGETLVKGINLNSSTVYKSGGNYFLQVTGFNTEVLMDGSTVLTVKTDAPSGYASWLTTGNKTITVGASGIRGVDTAGIIQYAPTALFSRTFSVNTTLAASAALTVSRHADSPLPSNVGSGSLGTVDGVEGLVFNVKAEYDDIKITDINNVTVTMGGAGGATSGVAYLYDGDTVVNSAAVTAGVANFTDMEIMTEQDTLKALTVKTDYSSVTTTLTTSTIAVNSATILAENSMGMAVTSLSGTATGYPVYLYSAAPVLALSGAPSLTYTQAVLGVSSSTLDAEIQFTVTAQGGNVTVTSTPKTAITAGYTTSTYAGATTTGVTVNYNVTGSTEGGGLYTIAKDTTATVTVDVHVAGNTLPAAYQGGAFGYITLLNLVWNGTQNTNWFVDIYKTGSHVMP